MIKNKTRYSRRKKQKKKEGKNAENGNINRLEANVTIICRKTT